MPKYEVPITYKGLSNFIVVADTPEQTKDKAEILFKSGEPPVELGNESEWIDEIHDPVIIDEPERG